MEEISCVLFSISTVYFNLDWDSIYKMVLHNQMSEQSDYHPFFKWGFISTLIWMLVILNLWSSRDPYAVVYVCISNKEDWKIITMYSQKENFKYSLFQVYFSSIMTTYDKKYGYGNYIFKFPQEILLNYAFSRLVLLL